MGLFGKKKTSDGIKVMFYEGELPGFASNMPCQLSLTDSILRITKIKPETEVVLERKRIISIDLYSEQQYMEKFKGNSGRELQKGEIPKAYYVINYTGKDDIQKNLVFWAVSFEAVKMGKLRDEVLGSQSPTNYEI